MENYITQMTMAASLRDIQGAAQDGDPKKPAEVKPLTTQTWSALSFLPLTSTVAKVDVHQPARESQYVQVTITMSCGERFQCKTPMRGIWCQELIDSTKRDVEDLIRVQQLMRGCGTK